MDKCIILDFILKFILTLYGESSYPRKIVQEVIEFLDSFLRNIYLKSLKEDILLILKDSNVDKKYLVEIDTCFNDYSKVCDDFSTESRRFSILQSKGFFYPNEFSIGFCYIKKFVDKKKFYVLEECFGARIPLKKHSNCF